MVDPAVPAVESAAPKSGNPEKHGVDDLACAELMSLSNEMQMAGEPYSEHAVVLRLATNRGDWKRVKKELEWFRSQLKEDTGMESANVEYLHDIVSEQVKGATDA